MGRKFLLLANWRGTLVNPDEADSPVIKENKDHADIVHKLHINSDFARLLTRFQDDLEIVVYSYYFRLNFVRSILKKAGLADKDGNSKITVAYMGQRDSESDLENVVAQKYDQGHSIVIILDSNQGCKKVLDLLESKFNTVDERLSFYTVFTRLYSNSGKSFAGYTYHRDQSEKPLYYFADSVADINNFLACLLNKPQKAQFIQYNADRQHDRNRLYLFDYYPTGEDAVIEEPFSKEMISQVKGESVKTGIPDFFFSALAHYIISSGINLNSCAFVVIPSHSESNWNPKLMHSIKKCILDKYNLIDSRYALKRKITIPKQSQTGHRDFNTQLNSLYFDQSVVDYADVIVLIDDFTTSGISVDACKKAIENTGYSGKVLAFAVGGTQSSLACISPIKYNVFATSKPTGKTGYIFDLDGTLIDSSIARRFRESGEWERAYSCIPQMKPYGYMVTAIRGLIRDGYDVAIVTSSISRYCYNVLHFLGIETDNISIVCYHDSKEPKPDPESYIIAYNSMAHENQEIICVGDEYTDIEACFSFGSLVGKKVIPVLLDHKNEQSTHPFPLSLNTHDSRFFDNEIDFLFYLNKLPSNLSRTNPLYQYIAQSVEPYFKLPVLQSWLEKKGLIVRNADKARIPTENGEKIGITYENTTSDSNIRSITYSPEAQKVIFKSTLSPDFVEFVRSVDSSPKKG